ncbi:DUF397 domain-containing protein [Streptomyces ipomoeae]|uniref:DUF397 domain-containing protein n=1 Tax=Streptomyces ipomoeae TaxID=103232 RepID=UPI000A30B6D0|nr:DUF397 domain-containing protein [Streptomyces ipomoeae]MDX2700351.1 DUF397 domain-containing protein [Streptomyces ipomoeae]MDX2824363.1 DUF397 domain-containing protein [Streptomyces ipomoeae]MDX2845970.1 DUF397 domain-containing protein [Streptomyces ipomoeae]MDX2877015.1 DUF397 domain-containing protein [Streptomyces ipomoeae]
MESGGDGRLVWFTSSYSNGAGGECVECAITDDRTLIRDSKRSEGPFLAVGSSSWRHFLQNLRRANPTHS